MDSSVRCRNSFGVAGVFVDSPGQIARHGIVFPCRIPCSQGSDPGASLFPVWAAASYDKLRRFDLADQAYAQAIRLGGETVQILNDQGYSYMLRGNLNAARRKFEKAYSLDPGNPVIANNLELLNGSRRFIERPPNNQP
ncbi:tetratricopeptide repeat protein [Bradyrhizobium sp. SHOUNA76]|uniref:tetratricopeptide repeat protein n=1 Tax=Bradyrhizobium sp. SHOUNA76 TaxID=2908927 RepID=UPI001FF602E3|nr:tetratricopeptide repeat protein [Bradyrhizobium sp. SHOUNA76]MCJ9700812.1 tetratricopeptide repeat protein [Bradyrhizobium sp. SHOUNA76]